MKLRPSLIEEESGLAAIVDMNVLPGLDRFCGFAD
jgi:hypothetical protein